MFGASSLRRESWSWPPWGEAPGRRLPFGLPGAEIVARYLAFWEQGDNSAILRQLLRGAVSDRRLAAALERHVMGTVIRPFAEEDQSTDAHPRARLAFAALLGLAVSRYVLRQEPLASADHDTLTAWMGPSLDHFLRGRLDGALTSAGSMGTRERPGRHGNPSPVRSRRDPRRQEARSDAAVAVSCDLASSVT
jgi:hypothetical protein